MNEEIHEQAVSEAMEAFCCVCKDFDENFVNKIGNIDTEPERERIFLLEEMLRNAHKQFNGSLLDFVSALIGSIDERALIERKKENLKRRE